MKEYKPTYSVVPPPAPPIPTVLFLIITCNVQDLWIFDVESINSLQHLD